MIRDELRLAVADAVARAQDDGAIPASPVPDIVMESPANVKLGDYATSLPLKLRRATGMDPLAIANAIAARLRIPPETARAEVARPGFVNFTLANSWLQDQAQVILDAGEKFGSVGLGLGQRVQVEYVSANPTGPLHVGAGRNAALGDGLANVLEHAGFEVQREYYVNDAGTQTERLTASVWARYLESLGEPSEFPEDGYRGAYVAELGAELVARHGRALLLLPREQAEEIVGREAAERVLEWIRQDLDRMNVRHDAWFSERSLYARGLVDAVLAELRSRGFVAEREGATWFTATNLGLEKDEVLIRSSRKPTYFLSDIAYHYDKLVVRGFNRAIDVWGADHHGQVPRVKAALKALGVDPDRLSILLYQLVSVMRGGEQVRMGKRAGTYISLGEVLEEVGADAVRFFLIATSANAMMKFDLELARRQSSENPVHYVKYAHARTAGVLRNAEGIGLEGANPRLLTHDAELALLRKMVQLPEVVETAAITLGPHQLAHYAQEIAAVLHFFYDNCRVTPTDREPVDPELSRARLMLVAASKIVLANTLRLIGVVPPERM